MAITRAFAKEGAKVVIADIDKEAGFITGTNMVIDGGMTVKMIYEE
ncbi:MAG: hypothetical protein PWP27_1891 [Clostridiales bacterium]|jgi:hypothetical protein|nr:hypothetical protein [Clostridiales bacterium]MDK2934081.1 hypothetical protein [Clostridiales bacterium]